MLNKQLLLFILFLQTLYHSIGLRVGEISHIWACYATTCGGLGEDTLQTEGQCRCLKYVIIKPSCDLNNARLLPFFHSTILTMHHYPYFPPLFLPMLCNIRTVYNTSCLLCILRPIIYSLVERTEQYCPYNLP